MQCIAQLHATQLPGVHAGLHSGAEVDEVAQQQDCDVTRCSAVSSLCMDNLRQLQSHHPGFLFRLKFTSGWVCQLMKHMSHGCA